MSRLWCDRRRSNARRQERCRSHLPKRVCIRNIPLGARHRLENPGKVPLEMIEVQSGAYLGEDDSVRFEECYGRG